MPQKIIMLTLAFLLSGCFSIRIPLNIPPKTFSDQVAFFTLNDSSKNKEEKFETITQGPSPFKYGLVCGVISSATALVYINDTVETPGEAYTVLGVAFGAGSVTGYMLGSKARKNWKDSQVDKQRAPDDHSFNTVVLSTFSFGAFGYIMDDNRIWSNKKSQSSRSGVTGAMIGGTLGYAYGEWLRRKPPKQKP